MIARKMFAWMFQFTLLRYYMHTKYHNNNLTINNKIKMNRIWYFILFSGNFFQENFQYYKFHPPFLLRRNKVEGTHSRSIIYSPRVRDFVLSGRRWSPSCWRCLDNGEPNRPEEGKEQCRHRWWPGARGVRIGVQWGGVQSVYAWNPLGNGADQVQIPTTPPLILLLYSPPIRGVRLAPVTVGCRQKDAACRNRGARDTPRRDR